MLISAVMTKNPLCIHPEMSINDVRSLMEKEKIGHLPVLDKNNMLLGIMARKDLLKAGPSLATSLDMYEINYLLSRMTVKDVMAKPVITVADNEVVEEAARIMADNAIGCLPVMRGKELSGIITDTDLFHVFVNAFGARHPGVRITCSLQEKPGQIARLARAIAEAGGSIAALVTSEGDTISQRRLTIKISGLNQSKVEQILADFDDVKLEDIREGSVFIPA